MEEGFRGPTPEILDAFGPLGSAILTHTPGVPTDHSLRTVVLEERRRRLTDYCKYQELGAEWVNATEWA